jgi:serine/threonine protein kinase
MGCVGSKGLVKSSNQVDDIWDVFTRIKLLGRGASGEVWLVKDKNGDMHALKKLDRSDPQNQAMFEHECGILQKLDHPNILKFVDCYEVHSLIVCVYS